MDNNNNQKEGKFFNGFLLGLLVGAAVVFLLGTKKGKKLLKSLSEDGLSNISDIFEEAEELEGDDVEEKSEPSFAKASAGEMKYPVQVKTEEAPKKTLVRRFFRRSKTS